MVAGAVGALACFFTGAVRAQTGEPLTFTANRSTTQAHHAALVVIKSYVVTRHRGFFYEESQVTYSLAS